MEAVKDNKKIWRMVAMDIFALVPREARHGLDAILAERVGEFVFRSGAKLLMGFAPMPDEPDLTPFFRRWLAEGGELAMPVWLGGRDMLIRRIRDFDRDLAPGRGGIPVPLDSLPEASPEELSLVIAPGRAFSETCARMGRGLGCYDALFQHSGTAKVGVAYDFQIFPEIPADENDVPLDAVITPSRIVAGGAETGEA